jgi:hypothetical protein
MTRALYIFVLKIECRIHVTIRYGGSQDPSETNSKRIAADGPRFDRSSSYTGHYLRSEGQEQRNLQVGPRMESIQPVVTYELVCISKNDGSVYQRSRDLARAGCLRRRRAGDRGKVQSPMNWWISRDTSNVPTLSRPGKSRWVPEEKMDW